jgi:hypothetical protein
MLVAPVEGIEPPPTVLETAVLPLYYTGIVLILCYSNSITRYNSFLYISIFFCLAKST